MTLIIAEPPGRATRRLRAFGSEIERLRLEGYTFDAIREALAAVGVIVSLSAVYREASRRSRESAVDKSDDAAAQQPVHLNKEATMKIAVINFSGNVGKTTISRHLLLPRIPGAELIAIESLNANESDGPSLRGSQFGELQEYVQTVERVIVDIGASNVEDLLALMRRYQGSHEDFDYFIVPTVAARKQQQDTIATIVDLSRLGIPSSRIRIVFNMVEDSAEVPQCFDMLLDFIAQHPIAIAAPECRLGTNEIYGRIKGIGGSRGPGIDLGTLATDATDYKALISKAVGVAEKLALAQALATRRLACGVLPELDACFAALELVPH